MRLSYELGVMSDEYLKPTPQNFKSFRSFDDFNQAPAFHFAERARFHDAHGVANVASVFFVVCEELLGTLYEFSVQRVHQAALHLDGDGFVHFIA